MLQQCNINFPDFQSDAGTRYFFCSSLCVSEYVPLSSVWLRHRVKCYTLCHAHNFVYFGNFVSMDVNVYNAAISQRV